MDVAWWRELYFTVMLTLLGLNRLFLLLCWASLGKVNYVISRWLRFFMFLLQIFIQPLFSVVWHRSANKTGEVPALRELKY